MAASAASSRPLAVGAYIFAGGFTLGMKKHFNVLAHLEGNAYGVATMRHNQPEIPVYVGVENWPIKELAVAGDDGIDTVYGNPPCAAWSMAGRRGDSWRTDERVDCTRQHFELLKKLKPKRAWIWESVTEAYTRGYEFVDALTKRAHRQGYHVCHLLVDAQWIGLPQRRKRFFFIAHRGNKLPEVPRLNWAPPTTVEEAFRELDQPQVPVNSPENRYLWLAKKAEQGECLVKVFDRLKPGVRGPGSGRPGFLAYKLKADRVSQTVTGGAFFHPTEPRLLSMQEYLHLCGFPLDYHFTPRSATAQLSELARGVTPTVADWLGNWILKELGTEPVVGKPQTTLIDLRLPPYQGD